MWHVLNCWKILFESFYSCWRLDLEAICMLGFNYFGCVVYICPWYTLDFATNVFNGCYCSVSGVCRLLLVLLSITKKLIFFSSLDSGCRMRIAVSIFDTEHISFTDLGESCVAIIPDGVLSNDDYVQILWRMVPCTINGELHNF